MTAPREALVIRLSRKLRYVGGQCFKLAVDKGVKEKAKRHERLTRIWDLPGILGVDEELSHPSLL